MPPERSGIADYSELLLPALRDRCEIVVVEARGEEAAARDGPLRLPHRQQPRCPRLDRRGAAPDARCRRSARLRPPSPRRRSDDRSPRRARLSRRDGARGWRRRAAARPRRPRQADSAALGEPAGGLPSRRRGARARHGADRALPLRAGRSRAAGYEGPIWVVPHPAFPVPALPAADVRGRAALRLVRERQRQQARPAAPRGVRACARASPRESGLLLVGATSPGFDLDRRLQRLGLDGAGLVREGYVDESRLWQLMMAADVHVNLRSPTMGETSGTAIRALSLGKPLVVSDVGWFAELPDDVALKIPVDEQEVETLEAALELLATRPDVRSAMGERGARARARRARRRAGRRAVRRCVRAGGGRSERRRCRPSRGDRGRGRGRDRARLGRSARARSPAGRGRPR